MRGAILAAAIKIIADEGYEKLSMRKIADAIDYTPTTIYSYYKDKAQIVDDIAMQIHNKIIADVEVTMAENKASPPDDQLRFAFKTFLYSMADCADMGSAVIKSRAETIFGPNDKENSGITILQEFLAYGQRVGVFRELDDNISWMLITALIGFGLNSIENQLHNNENWPYLAEVFVDMLVRGLVQ